MSDEGAVVVELAEQLRRRRLDKAVLLLMVIFVPSPGVGHAVSVVFAPVLQSILGKALFDQIMVVFEDTTLWRSLVEELSR